MEYTTAWKDVNSSLVEAVYHDSRKNEMLVRLGGGKQYVYSNVSRDVADSIASAGSPGREYNYFRSTRRANQTGRAAHYEKAVERTGVNVSVSSGATTWGNSAGANLRFTPATSASGLAAVYEVVFKVGDSEYTSSVSATSLSSAVADVEGKLNALGLKGNITKAAVRS